MKIDNSGNINALTLSLLQSSAIKEIVKLGQAESTNSSPAGKQISQLSQLLQLINLFPSLYRVANQQGKDAPLLALLSKLVVPQNPQIAVKWLAERQPDNALIEGLKWLRQHADSDESASLKAAIQLLAEQRLQDASTKPGEHHWIFCFGQPEQSKVDVSVRKKTASTRKKSRWCVSVNLTLSNNRHLSAAAELEGQTLDLSFTTDSESLKKQLESTMPVLERQLAKHSISVNSCDVASLEPADQPTITMGLNIQV
ncbi:flagellar hook-length control protein FliK [Enterovibrio sp. ZSDZ35]|uniref:Flagellar hook-length control protein FliK n=1 Tax=Enterovibrio qingdaonensis TaxID=2899818 RepID=A0ABT5QRD4_9GAMM|nr:flagellar hook-length control protein FliK [Enterovibrio sp. ZSDZ35]MDD1783243.1 flagellar hook-length control protein FliK [Enterovibrio sp. ZSDZ35]